jgi:hypothetical protein
MTENDATRRLNHDTTPVCTKAGMKLCLSWSGDTFLPFSHRVIFIFLLLHYSIINLPLLSMEMVVIPFSNNFASWSSWAYTEIKVLGKRSFANYVNPSSPKKVWLNLQTTPNKANFFTREFKNMFEIKFNKIRSKLSKNHSRFSSTSGSCGSSFK